MSRARLALTARRPAPSPPGIHLESALNSSIPLREGFERRQIPVYFAAVIAGAVVAGGIPSAPALEAAINPGLALMLFVTFLQVPLSDLGRSVTRLRFIAALLAANFVAVPLFVAGLLPLMPADPMLRFGVLLVLLAPCIDYVVTFSHLGRAHSSLLLAATPILLGGQMMLLPLYLALFLGDDARALVRLEPFVDAFVWLIAVPLALAGAVQFAAARHRSGARLMAVLGMLPVPATAGVLFIVVAAMLPRLGTASASALSVLPIYLAFAVVSPGLGWATARLFRLEPRAGRSVAFSAATRNSLVVLPLALAVPGGVPLLPAIIVAQTMVELVSELAYIRLLLRLGRDLDRAAAPATPGTSSGEPPA